MNRTRTSRVLTRVFLVPFVLSLMSCGKDTPTNPATPDSPVVDPQPESPTAATLYMVGGANYSFYRLDPATGRATRVGVGYFGFDRMGDGSGLPVRCLAALGGNLYMYAPDVYTGVTWEHSLFRLDPATGEATSIGRLSGTADTGHVSLSGLTAHNGSLYGVGIHRTVGADGLAVPVSGIIRLYRIDPATANVTRVGIVDGQNRIEFDFNLGGLTSHNGNLLMIDTLADDNTGDAMLFRLDPALSNAIPIGKFVDQFGANVKKPSGLASHNGSLYMVGLYISENATAALYKLDSATGKAMRIGDSVNFGVGELWPYGLTSYPGD